MYLSKNMLLKSGHLVQIRIFIHFTFRYGEESLSAGKDLVDPVSFFYLDNVVKFILFCFCCAYITSHNRCVLVDNCFFSTSQVVISTSFPGKFDLTLRVTVMSLMVYA